MATDVLPAPVAPKAGATSCPANVRETKIAFGFIPQTDVATADPGDGQCWRNCPIMTGVLPTNVLSINRVTDEEGIDYSVILTETAETGDWPWP
jgi:hypothetical protein